MNVSCDCGARLDGKVRPTSLWAFLQAHTTPRVEPIPGVRQMVPRHNVDIQVPGYTQCRRERRPVDLQQEALHLENLRLRELRRD